MHMCINQIKSSKINQLKKHNLSVLACTENLSAYSQLLSIEYDKVFLDLTTWLPSSVLTLVTQQEQTQ